MSPVLHTVIKLSPTVPPVLHTISLLHVHLSSILSVDCVRTNLWPPVTSQASVHYPLHCPIQWTVESAYCTIHYPIYSVQCSATVVVVSSPFFLTKPSRSKDRVSNNFPPPTPSTPNATLVDLPPIADRF